MEQLKAALERERLGAYVRLRGGYPILLAGATYWGGLAAIGYIYPGEYWRWAALFGSGLIFPFALFYARIFGNKFMSDRTAVTSLLVPAFIGMLLFWPMAIAALWEAPDLFSLILAIGLSLHFPVIGWSYGKTGIFSGHAILRAILVFAIWWMLPDERLTLLPLMVSIIYLLTVIVIVIDSRLTEKRLHKIEEQNNLL